MVEHTATPWEWDWQLKENSLEAKCGIRHFDGNIAYSVARCPKYQSEQQWKADGAFIVKACNNFDEMYEALKAIDEADDAADGKRLAAYEKAALLCQHVLAMIEAEK